MKKSPYYPHGCCWQRSFWILRNGLAEPHPQVVVAFLLAQPD